MGNVTSSVICYLIPSAFYLKLTEGAGWTTKRLCTVLLLLMGIVSFVLCTASSIYSFFV